MYYYLYILYISIRDIIEKNTMMNNNNKHKEVIVKWNESCDVLMFTEYIFFKKLKLKDFDE